MADQQPTQATTTPRKPARSIGSTTIRFGQMNIPVKLFTTLGKSDDGFRFVQLHKKDNGRLQQRQICTTCNETVEHDQTIRGHESEKGKYVGFSADELGRLDAEVAPAIALREYVPFASINVVLIEKSFYVAPEPGAEKSFRQLCRALTQTGRVAVGTYTANRRQMIACLRPLGNMLVMHQLRYAHESIDADAVPAFDAGKVTQNEVDLAAQIVVEHSKDTFDPATYRDEVQPKIQKLIDLKLSGEPLPASPKTAQLR